MPNKVPNIPVENPPRPYANVWRFVTTKILIFSIICITVRERGGYKQLNIYIYIDDGLKCK